MKYLSPLLNFLQVIGQTFGFTKKQLSPKKFKLWKDNEDIYIW